MNKARVLFLPPVDADNTNAQSLNVREIVLRLDPERIESTLWYERAPDARLCQRPGILFLKLPQYGKTLRILKELLSGYDIIAYMDYSPASYLLLHTPRLFRGLTKTVFHAEGPMATIVNPPRLLKLLVGGVLPNCDVHTGITEFVARDMARALDRELKYVLPVGVDTAFFTQPLERNHAVPIVLFVGTLIERKGPQHLLTAAARFPQARFRIVGAGRDGFENVLRQKAGELQVKNVTFEGPRTQPEVRDIMRQSDIFVLPSRLEGIPKVTLEAAATGLPCIVFRDYQTPSVLDGVTGFQVSTLEEMLSRLAQLIQDSILRNKMGVAARRHALTFDWDLIAKRWERTYLVIACGSAC
ncbi:MAG TPA: glycosyltransferase family 4 protein [Terriglobales bacterium]|nr:glycosyltransferase family 4 protein [Terriglobales bacterium]